MFPQVCHSFHNWGGGRSLSQRLPCKENPPPPLDRDAPDRDPLHLDTDTLCWPPQWAVCILCSGSREGPRGPCPPPPTLQKLVTKKIAAKGGHIDFMFLAPTPTRPLDLLLVLLEYTLVYYFNCFKIIKFNCLGSVLQIPFFFSPFSCFRRQDKINITVKSFLMGIAVASDGN